LKDGAERSSLRERQQREIRAAAGVEGMAAALDSIVDERGSPDKRILAAGTPILQPTAERRSTGSHYTPRSLTEPIVRHALEPIFERLGLDARPEEVLDLKVCDAAMGSGAFLVEACRALAARLVQAWARRPETRPKLPPDEDEDLHARRLVSQRCLYGVDKNPMATDLAKLSLWLATLARDHEFTFLDHALKSGDSLVGLTQAQISAVHWDTSKPGLPLFKDLIRERLEAALTGRREIREAHDDVERAIQEARYQRIERRLSDARLLGDVVIAAFFRAPGAREAKRQEIESWLNEPPAAMWTKIDQLARVLRQIEPPVPPFHWELEFPEVFARDNPGFDAVVGNPPFMGGKNISGSLTRTYLDWLTSAYDGTGGQADLVSYFFRRAFEKIRLLGCFGLISTNTISQGDTRRAGLGVILSRGGAIYSAIRRLRWPGAAAVIVSVIHVTKGRSVGSCRLDGHRVDYISAYLFHSGGNDDPRRLAENQHIAFTGGYPYGAGFIFDDASQEATPISVMEDLVRRDPRNAERIFPYIGGAEFLNDPEHRHKRFVINFGDMTEDQARCWPDLYKILETKVKPERAKLADNADGRRRKEQWWQWGRLTPGLDKARCNLRRVLMHPFTSANLAFSFVGSDVVVASPHPVFAVESFSSFAVLQSRVHEVWVRFFSSSFKDDLRYTASDSFETFPLPDRWQTHSAPDPAGKVYYEFRAALMVENSEGLAQTYNRFHDRRETAADIVGLRELHTEMDRAVLRAYGWDGLAEGAEPQFLDEANEDDHKYQGRLFWPAEFRDEVLARLLTLNAERAAAERESEPLALRARAKRPAKGLAEAELLASMAADKDD
jgi:hypothetical protein